jgi:hypothetical protein
MPADLSKFMVRLIASVVFMAMFPVSGFGGAITPDELNVAPLTPGDLTLEALIESQAENVLLFADLLAPDPQARLSFTSNIDPSTLSFNYMLPPTPYLGRAMTLSGTGTFDSATNTWALISTGMLAGPLITWGMTGTLVLVSAQPNYPTESNQDFKLGGVKIAGIHDDCTLDISNLPGKIGSSCTGFTTDATGDKKSNSMIRITDDVTFSLTGNASWHYVAVNAPNIFSLLSAGLTPTAGGPGSFTTIFQPPIGEAVPEPLSVWLVGCGLIGLAIASVTRRSLPKYWAR